MQGGGQSGGRPLTSPAVRGACAGEGGGEVVVCLSNRLCVCWLTLPLLNPYNATPPVLSSQRENNYSWGGDSPYDPHQDTVVVKSLIGLLFCSCTLELNSGTTDSDYESIKDVRGDGLWGNGVRKRHQDGMTNGCQDVWKAGSVKAAL